MWQVTAMMASLLLINANCNKLVVLEVDIASLVIEIAPDLFTKTTAQLTGHSELTEKMYEILTAYFEAQMPGFQPCFIPHVTGAMRYLMDNKILHGKYEAMSDILELVKMETGTPITINEALIKELQHAIAYPLYDAMDSLECEIGLLSCTEHHNHSEAAPCEEELYNELHYFLSLIDFRHASVGTIIVGGFDSIIQWYDKKITTNIYQRCIAVNNTVDVLETALDEIKEMNGQSLINEVRKVYPENAEIIASYLTQELFFENAPFVTSLERLILRAETIGLQQALLEINIQLIGLIYEAEREKDIIDAMFYDVISKLPTEMVATPLSTITLDRRIRVSALVLNTIFTEWEGSCLKARILGMFSGLMEVYHLALNVNLQVIGSFDNEITDAIIMADLHDVIDPFIQTIHELVGRQPTEVSFIRLEEDLSDPDKHLVIAMDLVYAAVETLAPMFGYWHDYDDAFVCVVTDEDFFSTIVLAKAVLLTSIDNDTSLHLQLGNIANAMQTYLNESLGVSEVPLDAHNETAQAAMIGKGFVDAINAILNDQFESWNILDNISNSTFEEAIPLLVEFLATNYGTFVHNVMLNRS